MAPFEPPASPPTAPPLAPPPGPAPALGPTPSSPGSARPPASETRRTTQRVARWLHVYASMLALVLVLFFGLTGLTLNHPDWGGGTSTEVVAGTFPFPVRTDGTVAWLPIAEHVRSTHDVKGTVESFEITGDDGSIVFSHPGYAATLRFDAATGAYELTVEQQGLLAVMNDLHKGRDAAPGWRWAIDVAAVFLVVIALTGLVLQLVLRRRRGRALLAGAVGAVVVVVLAALTLR